MRLDTNLPIALVIRLAISSLMRVRLPFAISKTVVAGASRILATSRHVQPFSSRHLFANWRSMSMSSGSTAGFPRSKSPLANQHVPLHLEADMQVSRCGHDRALSLISLGANSLLLS